MKNIKITENGILIKSKNGIDYLYDSNDNNIYKITNESELKNYITNPVHRSFTNKNSVRENINNNAKTLIIEITEECNLRCPYCVFDEKFAAERSHSQSRMPEKTIFESIDSFMKRAKKNNCYIIFYGGEPLLAFDQIKNTVNYIHEKHKNKNVKYSLTTNGVQLNKKITDYLSENNFLTTISIDGPEKIHDLTRINNAGKGTFNIIKNNLDKWNQRNPEFTQKNILINCTISNTNNLVSLINDLYTSFPFLKKNNFRFAPIIQESNEIDSYILNSFNKYDNIEIQKLTEIQKSFLHFIIEKIRTRKTGIEAPTGKKTCIPFQNRTYIRNNGDVQFCERIGSYAKVSKNQTIKLGKSEVIISVEPTNIVEKSIQVLNEFQSLKHDDCMQCFAYNFCSLCPASFIKNNKFDNSTIQEKCDLNRKSTLLALEAYINDEESKVLIQQG
jgi:uncharacterized protein